MSEQIKKIKVIEAINPFVVSAGNPHARKLRVAAYARVSTDEEDQANSFDNQIDAYQKLISENDKWIFSGMYADKGITGTQMKKRDQFMKMIDEAKNGRIDLILTKSISRFGRNTVEILQTVRELRELNVEVFFEKENLNSSDTKLDFVLTIMSSVAQEESRSISENIKWSVKKRFKEGKVILNTTNFLGYKKDGKGSLEIISEEADIVREIYNDFLRGHSPYDISKMLMKRGVKTGTGNLKWTASAVLRILQNEKYSGDAILQKTYTVDYLTHKRVQNINHADKYFVENSHPAIIEKDVYTVVQKMLKKELEETIDTPKNSKYPLTNLVFCAACKRPMKRHFHNYGRASSKVVLNCNHAPKNPNVTCSASTIDNELVISALNDVIEHFVAKESAHDKVIQALQTNANKAKLSANLKELNKEHILLVDKLESFVNDNMNMAKNDPDSFNESYSNIKNKLDNLNKKITKINLEISKGIISESRIEIIREHLKAKPSIAVGILIKSLFKIVLVTPSNDLLIVLNTPSFTPSEILNDFSLLNDAACLIDKTHFDKKLNKNISYKVVKINES